MPVAALSSTLPQYILYPAIGDEPNSRDERVDRNRQLRRLMSASPQSGQLSRPSQHALCANRVLTQRGKKLLVSLRGRKHARAAHDSCAIAACDRSGSGCCRGTSGRARAGYLDAVTNASMATTFNVLTRATITHCNGVRRINFERAVGQFHCPGGYSVIAS